MSQLLLDWLNEDVGLSRKVVTFRDDFRDGYLLGELLSRFNQQMDFEQFSVKGTPAARLSNFCLLEPTMRKIGVHFNSRIVTDIIAGKEAVTKNLLYEMKTALEGIYRINKQSSNQMLHGTASDKALHVIKTSRPNYEKTLARTFEKAVHASLENNNDVMMEEVMRRHTSKEIEYLQTMSTVDDDAYNAYMSDRMREKEINRTKKAKADEFAKTREAQHVQQWKVNQRVAHDRRVLKAKVEQDLRTRKYTMQARQVEAIRQDTQQGVDAFNDRLESSLLVAGGDVAGGADSLIKTMTSVPGESNLTLMYVDRDAQQRGLAAAQKKMKEHHEDFVVRTQVHDQRRRRFLREYDTTQMKMSQKIFHTEVIAQLLNFAASEKVEQGQMEEVVNYKMIIPENRHNREELMGRMAQADRERGVEWDAVEAQREVHWTIGGARASHGHRSAVLQGAVDAAKRQRSTAVALQTLDKLLDVVDWVVSCRQVGVFHYALTEDPPVLSAPLPEAAPANGKKGKEKEKEKEKDKTAAVADAPAEVAPKPRSCEEGEVVPGSIWADAVKMFLADEPVAAGLPLPAPLQVTDALWPYSISDRPACAEVDWLFAQPFHGAQLLQREAPVVPPSPGPFSAATSFASPVDSAKYDGSVQGVGDLAPAVAAADVREFVDALNEAELPTGNRGDESWQPVEAPPATEVSTLYTPTWLTNVEPRHFLGEAIIAVRCAVDPVPDEPTARIDTKHIPLRLALCGVSELAKKNMAEAMMKQIPGLTAIAVAELVSRAFEYHCNYLAQSDTARETVYTTDEVPTVTDVLSAIQESLDLSADSELGSPTGARQVHGWEGQEESVRVIDVDDAATAEAGDVTAVTADLTALTAVAPAEAAPVGPDPYIALASEVHDCLLGGRRITDELYVSLIVHAVQQIHQRNTGYVLQDFPSTKRQALLLMEAFSGMDYDAHRPQPADKRSPYAPPHPAAPWTFDVSKCGLDAVVHVDNGPGLATAFDQRACVRRVTATAEVVYVTEDQVTIKGLERVEDPTRPFHATGIDLSVAEAANKELLEFCARINLLRELPIAAYNGLEAACEAASVELRDRYIPAEYLLPGYLPGTEPIPDPKPEPEPEVVEEQEEPVAADTPADQVLPEGEEAEDAGTAEGMEGVQPQDGAVEAPAAQSDGGEPKDAAPADGTADLALEPGPEEVKEKYIYQPPPIVFQPNAIPVALAEALLRMWNTSEEQSNRKSATYFSGMRDVRAQMLQRRRAAFDCVSTLLVKLDNRQELFDAFRKSFNGVPADMRFDPECVAELHLQKLELCDALLKLSETRRASAETYVKKVSADAVVTVLQHRCRCESAAVVQSELQRFFVALHLIFDYSKSVRGYAMPAKILNDLEVTLPVTMPAEIEGGKKEKPKEAKKGKEVPGALVPFREPLPPVLLSRSGMDTVPEVNGGELAADSKSRKAPAKDKKGSGDSGDPFADIEAKVLEEAEKWRKGAFLVTREVYERDEALCGAIEQAIWYEADKLVLSIRNIRAKLESQLAWLDAAEQELGAVMLDMVTKRYLKELAAVNQLMEKIEQRIEDALPVPDYWLVSPDALAVDPATVWDDFGDYLPEHLRLPVPAVAEPAVQEEPETPKTLNSFKPSLSPQNKRMLDRARRKGANRSDRGFVPEHTEAAEDLAREGSSKSKKRIEKQPVNSKTTHLRRASTAATPESIADEKFRKEMAVYDAKRLTFEDKLMRRRAQREKEFRQMGMSAVTAKLAAYNELLLDEQQDMQDFEAKFRPKRRPTSHAARRASSANGNGARRPSSAVKPAADQANRRPSSARAAVL